MKDHKLNPYFGVFNRELKKRDLLVDFFRSPDYKTGELEIEYSIDEALSRNGVIGIQLKCLYEMTGEGENIELGIKSAIMPGRFREEYLPRVMRVELANAAIRVGTPKSLVYKVEINGKDSFDLDTDVCEASAKYESELSKISAFDDFTGAIKLAFKMFDDGSLRH